jgi:hypothetical protein
MNNKVKQALGKLTPESAAAYYDGKLPARMVIAMSRLTFWEQRHMFYESDPLDSNRAMRCGLFGNDGKLIEPGEDRKADIQAVIDIFLEDQLSVRISGQLKKWDVQ